MSSHPSTTSLEQERKDEREWPSPMPPADEARQLPLKAEAVGNGRDPNLVDWEENDMENPRNWSTLYKSWLTFQLSMLALSANVGVSIIAPAEDAIAEHIGVSSEVSVLAVSLYV